MTVLVCYCTCPDLAVATRIAELLVEERLAACVSLWPGVQSVYRWQGTIQRDTEVQLLIKTTRERLDAVLARVVALHPNELPELLAVDVAVGWSPYLDWIGEQTRMDTSQ